MTFLFQFALLPLVLTIITSSSYATYIATFDTVNNGIDGYVSVSNGYISVNIDISSINESLLPPDCLSSNTLKYHLHNNWTHNSLDDRIGSVDCSLTFTANHFDPWQACGPASDGEYCSNNNGCINISTYACNSANFALNPYSCEIGDWSGKYGLLAIENESIQRNDSSFWEIRSSLQNMNGKSVVFHCGIEGERAFCAPFIKESNEENEEIPNQSSFDAEYGVIATFDRLSSNSLSMYANGEIFIDFLSINDENYDQCTKYGYAIFDKCSSVSNVLAWDPSQQCINKWSDSQYCNSAMQLCNDVNYKYFCNISSKNVSSFDCSPTALSSIYGSIEAETVPKKLFFTEQMFPPLDALIGKYVGLFCMNDSSSGMSIVDCALISVIDGPESTTPVSTSGYDNGVKDNEMAVVLFVCVISAILLSCGLYAIYYFVKRKNAMKHVQSLNYYSESSEDSEEDN